MRDVVIAMIMAYCLVVSLKKPYVGFLCWEWLSLMSPHKISYGFIVNAPVALMAILATLIGTLFYRNKGRLFQHGIVFLQLLFLLWTGVTYLNALYPESSIEGIDKFTKVMIGVFLSYLLVDTREKLNGLIWVIFGSVGFYGFKGGIFTLTHGGGAKVWGPESTYISDNNALACALLMILPIGAYLASITEHKRAKQGLYTAMALIGVSVLGSNSRGALVGLCAVFLFWLYKAPGKQRIMVILIGFFVGGIALGFMPESYWERMNTMKTYEKDASAMGRINAWWCAYNLANDRFTGAGFNYANGYTFRLYAPNPTDVHTAHSIYLQVLGDHGYVGLIIFLWICLWTWLLLGKIIKKTSFDPAMAWANQLARMLQLTLIPYFTAGAFLSLSYYDLYWQLVAVAVILNTLVSKTASVAVSRIPQSSMQRREPSKLPTFVRPVDQAHQRIPP